VTDAIRVHVLAPADYPAAIPDLAALLVDAVDSGASVSFLAGLDLPRATAWWQDRTPDIESGALVTVVGRDAGRIVGCAGLVPAKPENSQHRAEVIKVLVLRSHRDRGIASAILRDLEGAALERGRWLLILDTAMDVGAEALYLRNGWQDLGVVPDFAVGTDGHLVGTRFMWKRLGR
jgi:GNAT superfamily N-acetyltransferase